MVGYQDEATQHLSLGKNCFGDIDITVHELGHAVGMQHEHKHPDRTMIMVPENFGDRDPSKFKKADRNEYRMSDYDPLSVMHYQFNVEKGRCIPNAGIAASEYCDVGETGDCREPTPDDCDEEATKAMEDRRGVGLSEGDIRALNDIYPGNNNENPPTTRVCDKDDNDSGNCCTQTQSCNEGQGDCDSHSDCLQGLKCGRNNCKSDFNWGHESMDCCFKPDDTRVCGKDDNDSRNCCTQTKSCDEGQGDCDSDSDCLQGLKCGRNNCNRDFDWGHETMDCCYKP